MTLSTYVNIGLAGIELYGDDCTKYYSVTGFIMNKCLCGITMATHHIFRFGFNRFRFALRQRNWEGIVILVTDIVADPTILETFDQQKISIDIDYNFAGPEAEDYLQLVAFFNQNFGFYESEVIQLFLVAGLALLSRVLSAADEESFLNALHGSEEITVKTTKPLLTHASWALAN
jgi:hypothetical protein